MLSIEKTKKTESRRKNAFDRENEKKRNQDGKMLSIEKTKKTESRRKSAFDRENEKKTETAVRLFRF